MNEQIDTGRFQALATSGGGRDRARDLAAAVRSGDATAALDLAALWTHVAAVSPEMLVEVYDGSAQGWLARAPTARHIAPTATRSLPLDEFWSAFWSLVLDPRTGTDAIDITTRTAALTGQLAPEFAQRVATMSLNYPGVTEAAAGGYPVPFTMQALQACPHGSLGGDLHDLIVDNGFDLEVLERDGLGLTELPPPLDYLNARILQCHDLWHLVAGYGTTPLHEVAISGFQLGQFGHHYSSMFLAVATTKVAVTQPLAIGVLLDTILTAWVHGRETPPMLGIPWEAIWDRPIETIRHDRGIAVYASPYPADLLEQLGAT